MAARIMSGGIKRLFVSLYIFVILFTGRGMAARMMSGGISTSGGPGQLLVSNLDFGVSDSGQSPPPPRTESVLLPDMNCSK